MTENLKILDQLLNKEKALQDRRCKEIEKRLRENTKILQEEQEDHHHSNPLLNLTRADENYSSCDNASLSRALKTADSPLLDQKNNYYNGQEEETGANKIGNRLLHDRGLKEEA